MWDFRGEFGRNFEQRRGKFFGVDVNPREIEGAKIIRADLNKGIPDFGVKFDVIFAGEIIEHLWDDRKFIKECKEFLKPNGLLIITVPNLASWPNRIKLLFGKLPLESWAAAPFHYHVYTREKLNEIIKKEGFEILKSTSSYFFPGVFSHKPLIRIISPILADLFPSLGIQLMVFAKKVKNNKN